VQLPQHILLEGLVWLNATLRKLPVSRLAEPLAKEELTTPPNDSGIFLLEIFALSTG
jgi:hypothetical protein